jgi:hypothetical protein
VFKEKNSAMKTRTLNILILFVFISGQTFAIRTADDILAQKEIVAPIYALNANTLGSITLPMSYGNSVVLSEIERDIIKNSAVVQIHLVYTDHPIGIDLKALNRSRIKVVSDLRKDLLTDTMVNWKMIRQTNCHSEEEAKKLFHGIVILYKKIGSDTYTPLDWILPEKMSKETAKRTLENMADTTVYHLLNTLNLKNSSVIADFTGSMYPYASQVTLWFALNTSQNKISDVFFFNDGDITPDDAKIDGKCGGIYYEHNVNFSEVRKLAFKTVKNSNGGGDAEENDIEALLYAMDKTPKANGYLLIADNGAPPRDMELLHNIKKPVHIILCETNTDIEPAYLQLAMKTGGSVHTMNSHLTEMAHLWEGQKIKIEKQEFIFSDGMFARVK